MLIDSNIIIYAMHPDKEIVRKLIEKNSPFVSVVSYVEVLGYHKLCEMEREYLEDFFKNAKMLPISQSVLDYAGKLRQIRKMTLGDALIAGTALTHDIKLVTRNITDFQWIENLELINPFE